MGADNAPAYTGTTCRKLRAKRGILIGKCLFAIVVGACLAAPAHAQDAAAGEKDFVVCRACHQVGPGAKNAVGPVLNGVVGRKAGTYPDFDYSSANKDSGIIWTPQALDKYLTSPQTVVPHTKMIFPGLRDAQKRKDVISFLQQFNEDGTTKK
ncbi:c-type cytochrome [Rhodopila sp.]|uniref:c-type cytochrome n=1 Tax=Rhodopila sp. TaxID=2480087 RepID=UPI003D0D6FD6